MSACVYTWVCAVYESLCSYINENTHTYALIDRVIDIEIDIYDNIDLNIGTDRDI